MLCRKSPLEMSLRISPFFVVCILFALLAACWRPGGSTLHQARCTHVAGSLKSLPICLTDRTAWSLLGNQSVPENVRESGNWCSLRPISRFQGQHDVEVLPQVPRFGSRQIGQTAVSRFSLTRRT